MKTADHLMVGRFFRQRRNLVPGILLVRVRGRFRSFMKLIHPRSTLFAECRFAGSMVLMLFMILVLIRPTTLSANDLPLVCGLVSTSVLQGPVQDRDVENRPIPPSSEPRVRIRLRSNDPDTSLVFGQPGQQLLCFHETDSRICLRPGPLEITYASEDWRLVDGDLRTTLLHGAGILSIRTLAGHDSDILFEDRHLPGFVELVPLEPSPDSTKSSRLDVIVHVSLESYLPGVLDVELYGHWPLETFQAQAVAARSYALAESAFWASRRHFDLVAGPESQGWSGDGGSPRAREAVQRTLGTVLVHDGRVIPAYYSAACGGLPASAADAISSRPSHRISPLVPLDSRPSGCCASSPVYEWKAEFKRRDVDRALQQWLRDNDSGSDSVEVPGGPFQDMTVLERSPTGRPLAYGFSNAWGRLLRLDSESLRRLLSKLTQIEKDGPSSLRSSAFTGEFRGRRFVIQGRGWGHGSTVALRAVSVRGALRHAWPAKMKNALGHRPGPLSVMEDGEGSGPRLRLGAPRGGARVDLDGAARVSKGSGITGRCAPSLGVN